MSRKLQIKTISSALLEDNGRRLDCGPYMSGAVEARELLSRFETAPLSSLTAGYNGGIFNGPRFPRVYVEDPQYGIPFLGSTDILQADLSFLSFISREQIKSKPELIVKSEWTLITCSGTIGRMAFARSEMDGMAGSQHFMRVAADNKKISSGYLYAFLSSRFGVPLVVSGTYGAIIQHIEPHHLSDLPVPRLGEIEDRANQWVIEAAESLSESSRLIQEATEQLLMSAGLEESSNYEYLTDNIRQGWAESSFGAFSLRALNYDPRARALWNAVISIPHDTLGDLVDRSNFEGHIVFKRIDAEPEHSLMLVGQRDAFQLRPDGRWISKKSVEGLGLQVPPGTTVIPCHGTLGESELYCRATLVTNRTSRFAYSGDFYRCIPKEGAIASGYLYAFLRSRFAFRIIRSMSTGSKQQYQHPMLMANMPIPRLDAAIEEDIAAKVDRAAFLRDQALDLEDRARALVERTIEEEGY
jgi:type I restriction enzyme S subunit